MLRDPAISSGKRKDAFGGPPLSRMTLDWIDIAIALAAACAATALVVLAWRRRERHTGQRIAALESDVAAAKADPQAAMVEFLYRGDATLKQQAQNLHIQITALELDIARKRKRLSDLEKRPDRREGEVVFQQETLALLNRRLVEYESAARRMQVQRQRSALIRKRIESGALDPARAPTYVAGADSVMEDVKAAGLARLRETLDPDTKAAAQERARPSLLADWRAKVAQDQRAGPRVKAKLAK